MLSNVSSDISTVSNVSIVDNNSIVRGVSRSVSNSSVCNYSKKCKHKELLQEK